MWEPCRIVFPRGLLRDGVVRTVDEVVRTRKNTRPPPLIADRSHQKSQGKGLATDWLRQCTCVRAGRHKHPEKHKKHKEKQKTKNTQKKNNNTQQKKTSGQARASTFASGHSLVPTRCSFSLEPRVRTWGHGSARQPARRSFLPCSVAGTTGRSFVGHILNICDVERRKGVRPWFLPSRGVAPAAG